MIIKGKNNAAKNKFLKRIFSKWIILLLLLAGLIIAGFKASSMLKKKGYTGLLNFVVTLTKNYWNGKDAQPESISIEIKDKDIKKLEKNRANALERGVIINNLDGEYVSATIKYKEQKIQVKLRLKGHMTDHLQENKWSFRVKVKDNQTFMGMKRFSLQHPGTRGYAYEWIYHQLMKQEDIIALRYKFITIMVNGKDWGVYAVEENFEQELIANNHREKGPIIRFNPDLYWVDRYNQMQQVVPVAEYASYYSANPEAYREETILSDTTQTRYYLEAIGLMEGFRNGKIAVDEVFDVPRLAKFHAIIDLVGGQHSLDWSDVKYYYNPVTARLEPVAYESFTVFPFRTIAGTYNYVELEPNEHFKDLHTALFSNPTFFKRYIHELERIAEPAYLDHFFTSVDKELKANLKILNLDFPYKNFEKKNYYDNQQMITRIMNAPNAVHAYFDHTENNLVCLQLGTIESLPIQIKSVQVGTVTLKPTAEIIFPSKQEDTFVMYKKYFFTMDSGLKWDDSLKSQLKLNYSLLGASNMKQVNVFPFPHTDEQYVAEELKNKKSTVEQFSFLIKDELNKQILFKTGKNTFASDLIIPSGYKVVAAKGVLIDLKNGAKIISYSPLVFSGEEEVPIEIESSDLSGQGIELINAAEGTLFKWVVFKNFQKVKDPQWQRSGSFTAYESPVTFVNCSFYNSTAAIAIHLIRSDFSFVACNFKNIQQIAIRSDFSTGEITRCVFEDCHADLDVQASKLKLATIYSSGSSKSFNFEKISQVQGNDITIKAAKVAVAMEDMTIVELQDVKITASEIGITTTTAKDEMNGGTLNITTLVMDDVKQPYLLNGKAAVMINGAAPILKKK